MADTVIRPASQQSWWSSFVFMDMSPPQYMRSLLTPFNAFAALVIALGAAVTWLRFTQGLGATTNLTNDYPWGLWIGFDMLCGVALAAGGFVLAGAVHVLHLHRYEQFVRPAILTAFLGYVLAVVGLLMDLGRPWAIWHPIIHWQPHSVMFEVSLCVMFYNTVLFLEFLPMFLERCGFTRLLSVLQRIMILLIVAGIVLSTMHQSSLGGLFLLAPDKLHPLWYSPFIPLFFFVSAVIAGLAMVIVEGSLSHRFFQSKTGGQTSAEFDGLIVGIGRVTAIVLLVYFCLKCVGVMEGGHWDLLNTPYGYLFLVEVVGFVLLPAVVLLYAVRINSARLVRVMGVIAVLGVVLNRLNVSMIAFQWRQPNRYVPHWMEIAVTAALIMTGIVVFRWVVNRMPVLSGHHDGDASLPSQSH